MSPGVLAIDVGLVGGALLALRADGAIGRKWIAASIWVIGAGMLSVMADDMRDQPPQAAQSEQSFVRLVSSAEFVPAMYVGEASEKTYHVLGGCQVMRPVRFRSREEAEWAGKEPCTVCLAQQPREHVAHDSKDDKPPDSR